MDRNPYSSRICRTGGLQGAELDREEEELQKDVNVVNRFKDAYAHRVEHFWNCQGPEDVVAKLKIE